MWSLSFTNLAVQHSYVIKARYVVAAVGVLNIPNGLDDLPVLKDFGGQVFHTAKWQNIDWDGKRIMVIGNGCSANQVIPWILTKRHPKSLVHIVRSAQWVAPKSNYRVSGLRKR
jgi:cation diffusion facilitator CzcD-associated flavoprotein CzcO